MKRTSSGFEGLVSLNSVPRKEDEDGRGRARGRVASDIFGGGSAIGPPTSASASSLADPETAERIRKQPSGPGSGERDHQGVRDPAVCAEAMAAAAPVAAGEDGLRRQPGTGK